MINKDLIKQFVQKRYSCTNLDQIIHFIESKIYIGQKVITRFNAFHKNIMILYEGELFSSVPNDIQKPFNFVTNRYDYRHYIIGDILNEIEIENHSLSMQYIYSKKDVTLLLVDQNIFKNYFHPKLNRQIKCPLFKNNFLNNLPKKYAELVCQSLNIEDFSKDHTIFSIGQSIQKLYFIEEGEVSIQIQINKTKKQQILKLNSGCFLGYDEGIMRKFNAITKISNCKILSINLKFVLYICKICKICLFPLLNQQFKIINSIKHLIDSKQIKVRQSLNEGNVNNNEKYNIGLTGQTQIRKNLSMFYTSSIKSSGDYYAKNNKKDENSENSIIKSNINKFDLFEYNKCKYNSLFKKRKVLDILKIIEQKKDNHVQKEYKQIKQMIKNDLTFFEINNLHQDLITKPKNYLEFLKNLRNKNQNCNRIYQSKKKSYFIIQSISISELKQKNQIRYIRKGTHISK